jgi:hypothetical protein
LLGFAALPLVACGDIVIPQTLVLEEPSDITIEIDIFSPPYDMAQTSLVGGISSTITASLGFLELLGVLVGKSIVADVSVDEIAIAGTEIVIGGLLPTGTLCVDIDGANPGGGQALINPLVGVAQFIVDLNTIVYLTHPVVGPALGGSFPFTASIDDVAPLSLGDLIGLALGGSGGGLSLTQEIATQLPPDTPVIGPANVTATLTLATADAIPSDPLLDECAAFLATL